MEWLNITEKPFVTKPATTLVVIVPMFVLRFFIVRKISQRENVDPTTRRRWIVTTRNAVLFITFTVAVVIWLGQLRAIAATRVVIAAAIVIATKAFLLNIL